MATIYAYKNFNNYYNRIVKGQNINNINDFTDAYGDYDYCQTSTVDNFNENDGVQTSHILGVQNNPYFGDCSYILVCSDNINIDSKWFIVDQNKNCYGQYKLTLYRDVITENWNNILNADAFIERGIVSDNSPFIYNKENISTNQIKQNEYLLKDESECGWLVGYIDKNYQADPQEGITGIVDITVNTVADYEVASLSAAETAIGASKNTSYKKYDYDNFKFEMKIEHTSSSLVATYTYEGGVWKYTGVNRNTHTDFKTAQSINNVLTYLNANVLYTVLNGALNSQFPPNTTQYNNIYNNQNKIVDVNTGADTGYYRIDASLLTHPTYYDVTNTTALTNLNNALSSLSHTGSIKFLRCNGPELLAYYDFVESAFGRYYVDFSSSARRLHCKEAFDMFCIPYKTTYIRNSLSSDPIWSNAFKQSQESALTIAQGIAQALGSHLYDLQLLPYCPMTGIEYVSETIIDVNSSDSKRYAIVYGTDQGTDPKAIVLWCTSNKGSFIINKNFTMYNKKMQNQCELYRLSSPNYNGQFDFNVARNNGVAQFKVDYTYLPIQPYIHVIPMFNSSGIYSNGDFNDARGLICGGDFSISYVGDKWVEYKNQNKNYSNIFDRETQQLELQRDVQKTQQITGAVIGGLGSTAGSAAQAGMIFGPAGAAVAGGLAAGAKIAGGIVDYQMQEKLYQENMSARKDIFNMQLENIQAMPLSLTKVTAITYNNKIWPFIEEYDCTEEERVAIANYIRSNGMSIGIYGRLSNYVDNEWSYEGIEDRGYFKANIVKIDGIEDDTHLLNAINIELNKGVYTK